MLRAMTAHQIIKLRRSVFTEIDDLAVENRATADCRTDRAGEFGEPAEDIAVARVPEARIKATSPVLAPELGFEVGLDEAGRTVLQSEAEGL